MPTTTSIAHELLAFYMREQEALFQETHIPVAPTWVAEIFSAATALNDVGRKFAKYEEYGVKEYWVLDPKTLAHRFYSRLRWNADFVGRYSNISGKRVRIYDFPNLSVPLLSPNRSRPRTRSLTVAAKSGL